MEEEKINLIFFDCVRRFKSVSRAFRRGLITSTGYIIPHRPFHNRANTSNRKGVHSRAFNEEKKRLYGQLRGI